MFLRGAFVKKRCLRAHRSPQLGHGRGATNIDGIRITPATVVDNYEDGLSSAEIIEQFPSLNEEQISTILAYAAKRGYLTRPPA